MKYVTKKDIKKMNHLYLELGTYAAVAREVGFSPSTVKKYIIKDFKPIDDNTTIRFNKPLPNFDPSIFRIQDWGSLCTLSKSEKEELVRMWEELEF